ncbi:MAG TPA: GatB/YqeY domain-containing protein [Actinomycetota bacterium]|nr:GatB/YqeY domain-containing protein [Actinomycetota bacterium]
MSAPTLKERIRSELTAAMKAGDKMKLGTLRMLTTAIVNREKEVLHELSDDEVREVASREVKRRTESIEAFERGDRPDLVAKETAERDLLAAYAPEQLSDEQVDALIDEAIAATGATSVKEMGKVMGAVMGRARGAVDGAAVQAKVRARLGG